MFATFSYNTADPDDEVRVVPAGTQHFGGRRPLACIKCRAKKVKCTGEEKGCAKCRANGIRCVYPSSSERGAQGRRRTTSGLPNRPNASNCIASSPLQSNSGEKDGSGSPRRNHSPPSRIFSQLYGTAPSLGMDTNINDPLRPSSLSLPSPGQDSLFADTTDSLFDFSSKDPSLNIINMRDDISYSMHPDSVHSSQPGDDTDLDLEQLRSPVMNPFGDLDLWMPASTTATTPSPGLRSPQVRQTPPPSSSTTAAKNIIFDIQNLLSDTQPCSCSQAAVQMLEELELKGYNDMELSTDVVLNNQKSSLKQFYSWLACERCQIPMATAVLLALIIERLSLYLEKGVAHYIRELRQGMQEDKNAYAGHGVVGEYQIESRHEWAQVMRVLLMIWARELVSAVARLKKRPTLDSMLAGTERRTRRIITKLTSWEA